MNKEQIRVIVVDDSAFMRSSIKGMIMSDPELKVIATARDGVEALGKIEQLKPDIVTLDIEMPKMDGLETLKHIMEKMPTPVIIISSLDKNSIESTLKAVTEGAVDFISKDLRGEELQFRAFDIINIEQNIIAKIKAIVNSHKNKIASKYKTSSILTKPRIYAQKIPHKEFTTSQIKAVCIGISTGGPKALQQIIPLLPSNFPIPVFIVQHMPPLFIPTFTERLNILSNLNVKTAENNELIKSGNIYFASGKMHMTIINKDGKELIHLSESPEHTLYRPSIDNLMISASNIYGNKLLGIIMTGMGNDGTEGAKTIKNRGGKIFIQDEESCVVFGMPRSVINEIAVDKVVSLDNMIQEIINII